MRIMRWPFISLMLLAVSVLLSPEAKAEASSAGSVDYQKYCAECHNANLKGGGHGVALTGDRFRTRWGKGGVPPLATFIRSMMSMNVPANAQPSVVNGIAAFLLRSNGIAVSELKPAASEQKPDQTNWQGAAGVMEAAQRAGAGLTAEHRRPHLLPMRCCKTHPPQTGRNGAALKMGRVLARCPASTPTRWVACGLPGR